MAAADITMGSGGVVSLSVSGVDALEQILADAPSRTDKALAAAVYEEANAILNVSMGLVPVRRGILRASADISLPRITRTSVEVEFGFGGAAAPYAVEQHENVTYRHSPGRGPKFLERPALAAAADLDRRMAARLAGIFGGRGGGRP